MGSPFRYQNCTLCAGEISLEELADEFGTPLYVYFRPEIAERIEQVRTAFAGYPTTLCYSVKANPNLRLLRWLSELELGFDVVSGGEIYRLELAGVPAERIVFAGVGKSRPELERAVGIGAGIITLESMDEARLLTEIALAEGAGSIAVGLRINVDVDAETYTHLTTARAKDKFGIDRACLPDALDWLSDHDDLDLVCLHMHLGSQITSTEPYRLGMERLLECLDEVRSRGLEPHWINAGGGFGIAHRGETVPGPADYADAILPLLGKPGPGLILELGRYLVGASGCLVTEVLSCKKQGEREYIITDAGMTDFIRPALYEAYHTITPLDEPGPEAERTYHVAGPVCESTDILGIDRNLPPQEPGNRLAVLDAGAYAVSMSSNYNSRTRAAEVWVREDGVVELIRRRERLDDLLAVELDT